MKNRSRWIPALLVLLVFTVFMPAWAGDGNEDPSGGEISTVEELNGKRIGVQTGTNFDEIIHHAIPQAQLEYFNTFSDMTAALEANKIDAFPGDEPVLRLISAENDRLKILEERLESFEFGFVMAKTEKGRKLQGEMNEWLSSVKKSGDLDRISRKWTEGPEEEKTVPDYASLPAVNGKLRMATEAAYAPMNYFRGKELAGIDIDLAAQFCEAYGYALSIEVISFDGILPAVQTGKVDFAGSGITITEERKESVYFSDPYYEGGTMLAVLKTEQAAEGKEGFWSGLADSFEKTFVRESRWKLFAEGILNTLVITVLTILFGTALGFLIFLFIRRGGRISNLIASFFMWLIQGMPAVVLLMILFYVVFGRLSISGLVVSVIAFSLTFGATVISLLKMGVGAVDPGQSEAAYALGHTERRTFFLIVLPQALPHVLPAYKGEIVSLIKATSIVGYIAVQDLTKMGDIIRSRTYEAFFPLITVTVIYFVLEGILRRLVGRIQISFEPRKRKTIRLLKEVKTDD